MPVVQLGLRTLAAIRGAEKLVIYYDSELTGFGLRVMPSGHRSWIVEYRSKAPETFGAKRRMVIGAPDKLTPDEARKQARKVLAQIELGRDPAAERAKARKGETVSEMLQLYMDEKIRPTRKRRTAEVFASYIRKHVEPAIGKRQTVGLSRADVLKLHHAIGKTHPVTANRVVTLIAAAFSHAKKAGMVPENFRNPAREIDKFRERARERYLSSAELQRLGDTLRMAETEGLPWVAGRSKYSPSETCKLDPFAIAAIRLLLLTGCRSGEILNLRWSEVDLERGLLHLPDSKTGKKTIVLAAPAMEVLASLPRAGEFVIPGGAQGHRGDLRGPWARISSHAGLQGVRLHDLRHSFASIGAGAGLGLPIIGRLLGHAQPSTTARYSHLADDPLRRASHVISSAIANALEGNPGAEPIPMRAHQKA